MATTQSSRQILWLQVSGLAIIQGSITLTWLIYRVYLPQLLASFGFPGLAKPIELLEDALNLVMEPVMGFLSDRQKLSLGSRFPLIALGTIISSILFIAIPAIVLFGQPFTAIHGILPIVLILWALAMGIFRAPLVSSLGKYSSTIQLPQAMSLLTIASGIVSSFRPIANDFLLKFPPLVPFAVGSFVLLGGTAFLRSVYPTNAIGSHAETAIVKISQRRLINRLIFLSIIAICLAFGGRFLGDLIPKMIANQLPANNLKPVMIGIGIISAIVALPAGFVASRWGNRPALLIGLVATASLLLILANSYSLLMVGGVVIALITVFSLVVNGAVPLVLSLVPNQHSGIAIGLYFGCFSLAGNLASTMLSSLKISLLGLGILGCLCFAFVAFLLSLVNIPKHSD